jgi:zinc D-Ala-D-Ala carboxypeptidase
MPGSSAGRRDARSKVPFPLLAAVLVAVAVGVLALRGQLSGSSDQPGGAGSPGASPRSPGPSGSPSAQLAALPDCRYGSLPATDTDYGDWRVTLLDTVYRLPASYTPPNLVSTARAGFEGGFLVRRPIVKDLTALREAAEAAGHPIGVEAAYRSYRQQKQLFDKRAAKLGFAQAERKTARPGHSEHQLGTTLDFKTKGTPDVDQNWGSSPTGRWVTGNAWRYGFVLSYPRNQNRVTCYSYEPWHFRYVGRTMAARIHDSGLTVREFLWMWNQEHGS